jgi:ElaB/YqjD/DUF883 family membrane-anchored ribosome-binding protein
MTEASSMNKDKLVGDLRVVVSDAQELLRLTADQAGEEAAHVRSRLQAKLDQAKVDLNHLQNAALLQAKAASHAADEFVHQHPWSSIGIAAGVGLLMGVVATRS